MMLKKMMAFCLTALLIFALTIPALAEEDRHVISVSGSATVGLAADTAAIQIGVNTRSDTVREAQKENAQIMAAVMAALHNIGIEDQDIITSQFNVNSMYDFAFDSQGNEIRTPYYQVQNNVTVTIHDLSLVGPVLDAAMDAGANTSYGISFSSTQENNAYQKALTRAVEDAMQKAKVIAAAAGVELGDLLTVNATQDSGIWNRDAYGASNYFSYAAKTADAGTTITGGDISVSASVSLVYEFK